MRDEIKIFEPVISEIEALVAPISEMAVGNFQEAQLAVDTAKQIKDLTTKIDKRRRTMVDPLNARVKEINALAKKVREPLDTAEAHIKSQLVAFELVQEKIREQKFREAEEERKRAEAELLAKQEAERQALTKTLDEEEVEAAELFGGIEAGPPTDSEVAEFELRAQQQKAVLDAEAKGKEWDIKQEGIKNARKQWKCEVVDMALVPEKFVMKFLDEKAVLAAARSGVTSIPGVKIWQETTIAIGSNTYVPRLAMGPSSSQDGLARSLGYRPKGEARSDEDLV